MISLEINILTLNVWGIPFVSSDREARIDAICGELCSGQYDIVSLQEVWSQRDCQVLIEKTESVLPYSHYFFSGVLGAGLLVLSKYPIVGTFFHAWSVNGYFHRIQHADWFGGKGVGLCKILIGDQIVHLYNAHLHAEYDNDNDEYKTHRVIQAFDTAQFIEATRGDSVLQILAGDLNSQPNDITYKVILYISKMYDCCQTDLMATNECHQNSYTSKGSAARNPYGVHIDHIFVRTAESTRVSVLDYKLPFADRVPLQKFSFSDHEAILAKLKLDIYKMYMIPTTATETCLSDNYGNAGVFLRNTEHYCVGNALECEAPKLKRMTVLYEAIELCDSSLQQLKVDRILYYSISIFLTFLLVALVEYAAPNGFKTLYLLLKFVLFGVILFSLFMATIWNFMERNGILSGKTSMEIMLRSIEKFEIKCRHSVIQ